MTERRRRGTVAADCSRRHFGDKGVERREISYGRVIDVVIGIREASIIIINSGIVRRRERRKRYGVGRR